MRKGYVDRWTNIENCNNLLFFAQVVDELIFDYSIPSHRLPTLNSHYLCFDAINTIKDIDNHGVPEGTLRPIVEELYFSLENDPVFTSDNSPLKYFVKEQHGKYVRVYNPNDLSYIERRNVVFSLYKRIFNGNSYFQKLEEKIIEMVEKNDHTDQAALFSLTKSLITELVNVGYDQRYIRDVLIYNFFNKKTEVSSSVQIENFFSAFIFEQKKYTVIMIADQSLNNILLGDDSIEIRNIVNAKTKIEEERLFLVKADTEKYYIFKEIEALDPYSAAGMVEFGVNSKLSLYRLYDHDFNSPMEKCKFIVYDLDSYYTIVNKQKSAVQRRRKPKTSTIQQKMSLTEKILEKRNNAILLLLASNLHSLSLMSNSEENQILDLWAIVESVLDISQEHTSDRITQICSVLVPIIKQHYLYSLLEQLLLDIKNYDSKKFAQIIGQEENDIQKVILLAKFISDEAKREECNTWLENLIDFPLMKFRIRYYQAILKTRGTLSKHVEKHSRRVRWQIMRAYRNRNLIIHNGETMPYTPLLVENLHVYVDILLEHVISKLADGHNMRSMCQELFSNECEWNEKTEKKNANIPLDDDFMRYVLMT